MGEYRNFNQTQHRRYQKARALQMALGGKTVTAIAAELQISRENCSKWIADELQKVKRDTKTKQALWDERIEKVLEVVWPKALEGDYKAVDQVIRMVAAASKLYRFTDVPTFQQNNVFVLPGEGTDLFKLPLSELRALAAAEENRQRGLPSPMADVVEAEAMEVEGE